MNPTRFAPEAGAGEEEPALTGLSLRILRGALVRVRRLRDELGALRSAYAEREDLPGLRTLVEGMSTVAAEVERVIIAEARLQFEREQDRTIPEGEAEERFRSEIGGLVNALDGILPRLLQIARTPHGREVEALIHPVSKLVATLFRQELRSIELIFEPADDYAYELSLVDELMRVAKGEDGLRDQLNDLPQMVTISYPQHLEAETLVHGMIAHEIAHTVVDFVPNDLPSAPIIEAFDLSADERFPHLTKEFKAEGRKKKEAEALAREAIDSRLRRWYEEFACDALAVGMLGPAYVYSLADLDLASNRWAQIRGDAGHQSHPGLGWRLRRVIDQARRDYLSEERKDAEAWTALRFALDELEQVLPDEHDDLRLEERALLDGALRNLDEGAAVKEVLGYAEYSPQTFRLEIEIVWEKLLLGIPPAEKVGSRSSSAVKLDGLPEEWSEPMPWQSIFNGAYAHWQAGLAISKEKQGAHRVLPDHPRVAQDWMDFNAFIRGTIELASLHEQLTAARYRLDSLNAPPET